VAVAFKEMPAGQSVYSVKDETGLTLLGYIAFLDPSKETCAAALATLKAYGVQVKILTGDNDIITRKICGEVGLLVDRIVLGSEMAALTPQQLEELAETTTVFAEVSPAQKAAIIDALRRKGHVVGYMGDGINDGPALKAADVGISVDSAVDMLSMFYRIRVNPKRNWASDSLFLSTAADNGLPMRKVGAETTLE
jgi:P-type Mg2+ transporter